MEPQIADTPPLNKGAASPQTQKQEESLLDLRSNFKDKTIDTILPILEDIKEDVISLNLSGNELEKKEDADLKKIINAIPNTVRFIAVEENKFVSLDSYKRLLSKNFDTHLKNIEEKAKQFGANDSAADAAKTLHKNLIEAKSIFLSSSEPMENKLPIFEVSCRKAINNSREVLKHHCGWKEILANIASAIVSICSIGGANLATGRGFFGLFPKQTDTAKKLDDLEQELDIAKAPQKP